MSKQGLEQAQAALEHVRKAPVSPDGMRSPEEPPKPKEKSDAVDSKRR